MTKEEQIQKYETNMLIDKLSKMPPMVIATAYLCAMNYELYGVDVTKEWTTAVQNASALSKAYEKGYYEGLKSRDKRPDDFLSQSLEDAIDCS